MKVLDKKIVKRLPFWITVIYLLMPVFLAFYHLFIGDNYLDFWFVLTCIFGGAALANGLIRFWPERKKHKKRILPLCVALVLAFIAMLAAKKQTLAFWGDDYLHVGWLLYVLLAGFFLNAMQLSKQEVWRVAKVLVVVSAVVCLTTLLSNKLADALFFSEGYSDAVRRNFPYHGFFFNANHFAYYLTICCILAAALFLKEKKWKKVAYAGCFIVLLVAMVFSNTVGGYLGLIVGLILLVINAIRMDKKQIWYCVAIVVTIVLTCLIPWQKYPSLVARNVSDAFGGRAIEEGRKVKVTDYGTGRLEIWQDTLKYISRSPIIGYGGGGLKVLFIQDRKDPDVPHNLFLELAAYNGIIVAVLVAGFLVWLVINGVKGGKKSEVLCYLIPVLVAYLVSAMFGTMTFFVSPIFAIIVGICYSKLV